jgi:hypothetical protein
MNRLVGIATAWLLVASTACTRPDSDRRRALEPEAGPQTSSPPGSICPGCGGPQAGGETSDFNSGDWCFAQSGTTAITADDSRAIELGIERLLPLFDNHFRVPFHWSRRSSVATVSGYEATTEAELTVTVQRILYAEIEKKVVDDTFLGCMGWLVFDVEFELSTADGAFSMRAPARSWELSPDVLAVFPVSFNGHQSVPSLSDVTGTLRYELDGVKPDQGEVSFQIYLRATGARGRIEPWASFPGFDGSQRPLIGEWPLDGCAVDSFPIRADEPHTSVQGETPATLFMQLASALDSPMSVDARWATGGATELTMGVGQLEAACYWPSSDAIGTRTTFRLETADGRLNRELPVTFYFDDFQPAGLRVVEFATDLEPLDVSSFAEASGITGVQFDNADQQAEVWSRFVLFDLGGEEAMDGILDIAGYGAGDGGWTWAVREALKWCTSTGCPGQSWRGAFSPVAGNGGAAGHPGSL